MRKEGSMTQKSINTQGSAKAQLPIIAAPSAYTRLSLIPHDAHESVPRGCGAGLYPPR